MKFGDVEILFFSVTQRADLCGPEWTGAWVKSICNIHMVEWRISTSNFLVIWMFETFFSKKVHGKTQWNRGLCDVNFLCVCIQSAVTLPRHCLEMDLIQMSVMHKVICILNYTMFVNFQYDGPGVTRDRKTQQWLYHLLKCVTWRKLSPASASSVTNCG